MKKKIFRILCLLLCAVFVFSVMAAADFGNAEGGGTVVTIRLPILQESLT